MGLAFDGHPGVRILGLSARDRDSAACLLEDGVIRAAAQEERFSRRRHDGGFPIASIAYCMEKCRLESPSEIDLVACDQRSFDGVGGTLKGLLPEFQGRIRGFSGHLAHEAVASIPSPLREAVEASGNAGCALGAAMVAWQIESNRPRLPAQDAAVASVALGPAYTSAEIREFLDRFDLPYELLSPLEVPPGVAELVAAGNVVGVLQGGMEFGPATVGHRSILVDPRGQGAKTRINVSGKNRDPSMLSTDAVLRERAEEWLNGNNGANPMLIDEGVHPILHAILSAFDRITGAPTLINTSFSFTGEPIVCSPIDAYRCLMRAQLDCIVMEDVLVWRREQPAA